MSDMSSEIDKILEDLKQERDELRVKLELAKMDAGDEWEKIEDQLAKLQAKAEQVADATAEAAEDVGAAAKLLGEEIRAGFRKISRHF